MTFSEATIRSGIERAKVALDWLRAHASLVLAATLLLIAAVWLAEHDARVRREAELRQVRQNVVQEISALRQKADVALQDSRANGRVIRDLESRRAALDHQASLLRAELSSLRKEERARIRPAITPGHTELAGGTEPPPDPARVASAGRPQWAVGSIQTATDPSPLPLGEGAPQDGAGEGPAVSDREFRVARLAPDACREQLRVQDELIGNCEERAELNRAALEAAKRSALDLDEAIRAKDQMVARIEERHRAELELTRGSRLRRFGRALEYVGVGVIVGIAIAQ